MVNDPAVVPNENIYYPSPAPRIAIPYETFEFTVNGPPAVDNGRFTVPKEAWVFKCQTGDTVVSREVIVDREQTVDLGNACKPAK